MQALKLNWAEPGNLSSTQHGVTVLTGALKARNKIDRGCGNAASLQQPFLLSGDLKFRTESYGCGHSSVN